jgi:hypothetical protein
VNREDTVTVKKKSSIDVDLSTQKGRDEKRALDQTEIVGFVKKITTVILLGASFVYLCSVINVPYPIFELSESEKKIIVTAISVNSLGYFPILIKGLFSVDEKNKKK